MKNWIYSQILELEEPIPLQFREILEEYAAW